jgi:hypothetical protein
MTIEKVREQIDANPFVPFSICLADGRTIPVIHSDFDYASSRRVAPTDTGDTIVGNEPAPGTSITR